MSASFSVTSSTGVYDVEVAQGSLEQMIAAQGDTLLIADEYFRPRLAGITPAPIFLPATEPEKSLDRMSGLIEQMRGRGTGRRTRLTALGGGVIQDIAAFVASVYMRGLTWSYVPTTVLAMVDSCIGGKSSINVGEYKNLVGTFHPPQHIYIDPALAETLPRDQFAGGLIEAVKICFCRGSAAFEKHLSLEPSPRMNTSALEQVIVNSLLAKKHFIEIDEFDQKERLLLNFGHTFGHAIEGASHYAIPHGTAVGLGILCAIAFQRQRGIQFEGVAAIARLERHLVEMISTLEQVGATLKAQSLDEVMKRLASDKKHTAAQFTLILPDSTGAVVLERIDKSPGSERALRSAIETTIESFQR